MLAWRLKHFSYTEISLLLGVRFSSTKFAQRKNLAKASWQKLFNLVVIRLKCWLWRVFHSVDPLTSKIWFVNLSSICFKFFVKCWREFGVKSRLHSHAMFSSFKEEVHLLLLIWVLTEYAGICFESEIVLTLKLLQNFPHSNESNFNHWKI